MKLNRYALYIALIFLIGCSETKMQNSCKNYSSYEYIYIDEKNNSRLVVKDEFKSISLDFGEPSYDFSPSQFSGKLDVDENYYRIFGLSLPRSGDVLRGYDAINECVWELLDNKFIVRCPLGDDGTKQEAIIDRDRGVIRWRTFDVDAVVSDYQLKSHMGILNACAIGVIRG